jgi:hypothetical protein
MRGTARRNCPITIPIAMPAAGYRMADIHHFSREGK